MKETERKARGRIILFLKDFKAGKVKTRLATGLGDGGALDVYRTLVTDLLTRLQPLREIVIPYFNEVPAPEGLPSPIVSLLDLGSVKIQRGRDLGERMSSAFREVFSSGVNRAVLIGSDVPGIDADLLSEFLKALHRYSAAIGPAVDGGYYLIGFRRESFDPSIFRSIDWSTERVLDQTLERARSLGLSCYLGSELRDVDTLEDLDSLFATGFAHSFLR